MTETDETTLRLERLIPSPPELLFALFVEPAQLVKWWAPDGYEAVVDVLDVRPGGHWRVLMRGASGGVTASGIYRIVKPPCQLVFTWAWENASGTRGHETEVIVSFEAVAGGTRLVIEQRRFESFDARNNHRRGWSASLDRIHAIIRG